MKNLEKLQYKLNTDSLAAVTITDNDTVETVCRNKIATEINAEFETAENFFDDLLNKEHKNLTVEPRRKNGNAFKPVDTIFTISSDVPTTALAMTEQPAKEDFAVKKKKKKKKKNAFGLGAPELISLNVKASQVDDLRDKVRKLEDENVRLKEKNDELREEQLIKKYTKESNDSRNAMLGMALQQAPTIAAMFGAKLAPTGLNAAESNLSAVQNQLVEKIKPIPDETSLLLINVLNKIEAKADNFEDDFVQLLTKYQII